VSNKNENINLVKLFQDLMSQKKKEAAFELIDKNAIWHSDEIGAPWSGVHHGLDDIKLHFQNISGTTKNFQRTINELIEHNNSVIEIGELSCILNKTDQPFETEYVCIYKVVDAKITSYRIFEDSLKLYRAYFDPKKKEALGLKFEKSVVDIAADEKVKVIKRASIEDHFPAPAPGAVNLFDDRTMSVGMVQTESYPSYPHRNDYDEVHYVIKGTAKFKYEDSQVYDIAAGDVVYIKSPEKHEWYDCSPDFKLIFVQSKAEISE
jgi:ketosteroid isomerase-like protein/mannose-6-phosphate isomerase-like protein (cupin superfamily)